MQMWILKPPGFDPKKKWPLVYLVHGGPQGAWEDGWSYRWNPQLWAAQGYVVALPNPRGSTGFGQKYVDEISGDWGGKCYDDLMTGVDYLEKQPYIDKDRMAAAGASFGGYMMNWFAGQHRPSSRRSSPTAASGTSTACTPRPTSSGSTSGSTAARRGARTARPTRSSRRTSYAANLGKFKTPMLIIHNDLDFRVPGQRGPRSCSRRLQRQGVPSRFINFPDEGHWVLKPTNSEYWHKEVFAWLKKHAPPGGR